MRRSTLFYLQQVSAALHDVRSSSLYPKELRPAPDGCEAILCYSLGILAERRLISQGERRKE